jgi:hypothetical protein
MSIPAESSIQGAPNFAGTARAERSTRKKPGTVSRPGANRQFQFPE